MLLSSNGVQFYRVDLYGAFQDRQLRVHLIESGGHGLEYSEGKRKILLNPTQEDISIDSDDAGIA